MLDWTRYKLYTGSDERRNQPVRNRTTGRHLRQGGSSWTTGPAAAVPARRTNTQPGTLQLRSPPGPTFIRSPSKSLLNSWRGATSFPATTIACRSSSDPVLLLISKQRSTKRNKILRESDRRYDETLSVGNGYQLFPMQPSHGCQRKSLYHRLQGTANGQGQPTLPIVLPGARMKPS